MFCMCSLIGVCVCCKSCVRGRLVSARCNSLHAYMPTRRVHSRSSQLTLMSQAPCSYHRRCMASCRPGVLVLSVLACALLIVVLSCALSSRSYSQGRAHSARPQEVAYHQQQWNHSSHACSTHARACTSSTMNPLKSRLLSSRSCMHAVAASTQSMVAQAGSANANT